MDAEMDIQSDVFPPCFGYTSNKFWMDLPSELSRARNQSVRDGKDRNTLVGQYQYCNLSGEEHYQCSHDVQTQGVK
jgi:hypothetical protein